MSSSVPRLSSVQGAAASRAQTAAPTAARARDEGAGRANDPRRAPDVRWTPAAPSEERSSREAPGGYGGPSRAGGPGAPGGAGDALDGHVETLSRWCRSDWPLSGDGRAAASALAIALGVQLGAAGGGNGRGALGEAVRLVLAAAQADVATLRAALADHRAPAARALLGNVVGAPWLLGVLRLRGTTVIGSELRACTSREEAAAVLSVLFGRADANGGPIPALRALSSGWVRAPRREVPLLGAHHGDGEAVAVETDEPITLVLPLLWLDQPVPAEPPASVMASVLAGMPPRAASPSPFLAADDLRAVGTIELPRPDVAQDDDEADETEDEDATADDARSDDEQDEDPEDEGDEPGIVAPVLAAAPAGAPVAAAPVVEPEPLEADVMAAALERLRTRARVPDRVEASIASDDGVVEHVTDVVSWLAEASVVELRALARDGWAGEEAIEVARALAEDDPEINEVVRHARRTESELLVEIDARAASAWLRAHRPELAGRLDDVLEDDETDD